LPFITRHHVFFSNLTNPILFGLKTLSLIAFATLPSSFLKDFFTFSQRGSIKEYFRDSKAKSVGKRSNMEMRDISKLEVTVITAISSLKTLIKCGSGEIFCGVIFAVSETAIVRARFDQY
jgi:hypothetical protein